MTTQHPFAHLAPGPYRVIKCEERLWSPCPGEPARVCTTCDACLTDIRWCYTIGAGDGSTFVVGSECAKKVGLSGAEIRSAARAYHRERAEEQERLTRKQREELEREECQRMYGVRLTREELRDAEVQWWNAAKSWLENERRVEAQHVGKPCARLRGLELRVDHVASWEGRYGITRLYVLRDRAGNCLIWKTGGGTVNLPDAQMSKKEPRQRRLSRWFLAYATVKSHGERDGMRQTELTRLKTTAALGELETISEIRGLRT